MKRRISYCPVSKDIYLTLRDFLEPEQIGRVLVSLCDDFFEVDEDVKLELDGKSEHSSYKKLFDWAEDKHTAWYARHRNFLENNPKKPDQ